MRVHVCVCCVCVYAADMCIMTAISLYVFLCSYTKGAQSENSNNRPSHSAEGVMTVDSSNTHLLFDERNQFREAIVWRGDHLHQRSIPH